MAGADNDDAPEHAMIRIGPLQVDSARRQVFDRGKAVPLGGRAFEILLALVEARGALVTREDLLARVWGQIHVDDSTLRVHISKLRSALARVKGGQALIRTESGRGYRISAPVNVEADASTPVHPTLVAIKAVPDAISSLVGRDEAVEYLTDLVQQHRLVTLVGAGGIGKTRLAQAVASRLSADFSGHVVFVDLAAVTEPDWVPAAVSTALGKVVLSGDPTEMLVEGLKSSRALILLDNCEHLIEAAALLAEAVALGAPQVRVLSTSRESLRVDGEWVYRLEPLDVPAEDFPLADQALGFSAVQLFVERAASAGGFALTDGNAAYVCAICRRLDGLPLAIEMAAVQAAPLGAKGLADQLANRIPLEELGSRRTAISRHRTLAATLQWSHDLLSAPEQALFRRLSVFAGRFSLEDAVATDRESGQLLTRLSAQSLLAVDNQRDGARFRMLDTTRRYATDRLLQSGEDAEFRRRHARYMLDRFGDAELPECLRVTS